VLPSPGFFLRTVVVSTVNRACSYANSYEVREEERGTIMLRRPLFIMNVAEAEDMVANRNNRSSAAALCCAEDYVLGSRSLIAPTVAMTNEVAGC